MLHHLNDADFKAVLGGDDTAYVSMISEKENATNNMNTEKHYSHMPEGFKDKKLFDNLTSGGVYALTTQVLANMDSIAKLESDKAKLESEKNSLMLELAKLNGKLEVYADLPTVKANLFPDKEKDNKRVA